VAIYYIAKIKDTHPFTPDIQNLEFSQSILDSTIAGHTFNPSTLEQTQLLELYISAATMSAEANTTIT
jgi:hypothetical protein